MATPISDIWVMEIAIEPRSREDQVKMSKGISILMAADSALGSHADLESGQTRLRGNSELHLDMAITQLIGEFDIDLNVGAPQVAYRETVSRAHITDYTHKKQSGGSGQFACIKLVISPSEPGEGYSFVSKIVGGNVLKEYIPGIEKGIKSVMDSGPLAGFPVIDVKVELIDGA